MAGPGTPKAGASSSLAGLSRTRRIALVAAVAVGAGAVAVAVLTLVLDANDTTLFIAISAVAAALIVSGFLLWLPDLSDEDSRRKLGASLLTGGLIFAAGAFVQIQADRTADRSEAAAEKRQLAISLGLQKDLSGIDLSGRDLAGISLVAKNLRDAILKGADLRGAILDEADLRGADLSGADLRDASLDGADLQERPSPNFLRRTSVLLSDADLRGASLVEADLRGAFLDKADLRDANLSGADLRDTELSGADLRGAFVRLTLSATPVRWPEGFDPNTAGVSCLPQGAC